MTAVSGLLSRRMAALGYDYPPLYLGLLLLTLVGSAVGATAQRFPYSSAAGSVWAVAGGILALLPVVWHLAWGTISQAQFAVAELAAVNLLLLQPVAANDAAPVVLIATVIMVTATATTTLALLTAFGAVVTVLAAGIRDSLDYPAFFAVAIAFSTMAGTLVRLQAHLLRQERLSRSIMTAQAATDERQRIAREIHDVVAHSLTVTLLGITGARRALQEDRDVPEAIDALRDAERLGRQAMTDVRSTVHLLGGSEAGVADIDILIRDYRRAGVSVTVQTSGPVDSVSSGIALALYRIAQESMANVVKHAPGATVVIVLSVEKEISMTVENTVTAWRRTGAGSGLRGMRARALLLGGRLEAGPTGSGWAVRASFPAALVTP